MSDVNRCEHIIKEQDVNDIYQRMQHEKIASAVINQIFHTDDKKEAQIYLLDENGNSVHYNDIPMVRFYESDVPLIDRDINGKKVKHELFLLRDEFRRFGIAKRVHLRELSAYKKNEINQVYLEAAADGIMTWPRSPFNFKIIDESDERDIISLWREYVLETFTFDDVQDYYDIIKNVKHVKSLNKDYVIPANNISFADWYRAKRPSKLVKMYKDIDGLSNDGSDDVSGDSNAS